MTRSIFTGMMVFFFLSVVAFPLFSEEPVAEEMYAVDKEVRKKRENLGKDIGAYVERSFSEAREAWQKHWEPQKAWDLYFKIQKEIPEELIKIDETTYEAARMVAWREMKGLLEKAKEESKKEVEAQAEEIKAEAEKNRELEKEGLGVFKKLKKLEAMPSQHFLTSIEPSDALFQGPYQKTISSGIGYYEISKLILIAMSYLPTKRGAQWFEAIWDLYIEKGDFKEAKNIDHLIKTYSTSTHKRIETKMKAIKEELSKPEEKILKEMEKVETKAMTYEVITETSGTLITPYLQISFLDSDKKSTIRREMYDIAIKNKDSFHATKKDSRIYLIPKYSIQKKIPILAYDAFGNLEKKEFYTKEAILEKFGVTVQIVFRDEDFVLIPKGKFLMGSKKGEANEKEHLVSITNDFYLQKTEVTQEQWEMVTEDKPSHFKGKKLPVERVSWQDVKAFIKNLNDLQDEWIYRLPTEAEWEYAARGIKPEEWDKLIKEPPYFFGDDETLLKKENYGWYGENSENKTHEVATMKPNAFGLYDMAGNVWEWVEDMYDQDYGLTEEALKQEITNPLNDHTGTNRAVRGGSWFSLPQSIRSAFRGNCWPDLRNNDMGFRVLRTKK